MITIPRESIEYVEVAFTIDGTPVTSGVSMAFTSDNDRPTDWQAATALENGKVGRLVHDLEPGLYGVWTKVTDSPEVPVAYAGTIRIS